MITIGTNAYITEAEYTAYADERGITVNTASIEADLVKSADFIDTYYTFKGAALDEAQAMQLPTDIVTIASIKKGALKAAEMQQAGLLTLNLAALENGVVKRQMDKVDVLETETEYQEGTRMMSKRLTPELDRLLRPFTVGGAGIVRV